MPDPSSRRKCVALNNEGNPCGLYPIHGATVCHKHGGAAPQIKAAAARRVAEAQAAREVRKRTAQRGPLSIEEVYHNLIGFAGSLKSWEEYLAEKVEELTTLTVTDYQGVERAKEVTEMWRRALNDAVKVHGLIAQLNLDERVLKFEAMKARMSEREIVGVASLWRALLGELDLTPEQWRLVDAKVPPILRRLSEGLPA